MSGVKLSPKHGLNPCISTCFFCGESKNEIALLGRIGGKEDLQAPMKAVLDYEPCDECKKKFAEGVLLVEVMEVPTRLNMPIAENAYPTGRFVVIKPEALKGDFEVGDKALVLDHDFQAMFGHLE